MLDLIGQEKYDYFWDRFYTYFYSSADAEWFASIGLNMQRLAINYRHLSDDLDPYVINEAGFKWIDRVVKIVSFPQGSLGGDSDSSVAIGSSFPKPDSLFLYFNRTEMLASTPSSTFTRRLEGRTL